MGTLTGATPSITDHCPHKLPTSCRLTATALCCACQDKRPQSSSYSIYVDGVGLVMRGTRWQRYCFFCKEFWHNRVAATHPRMDPTQTRIPEHPDQTAFLERWFEYHRGYRLEKDQQGRDINIPISCEIPWRDVDPGMLPLLDANDRLMETRVARARRNRTPTVHTSLESTLDELLQDAHEEDEATNTPGNTTIAAQIPLEARVIAEIDAARDVITAAVQNANGRLNVIEGQLSEAHSRRDRAAQDLENAEIAVRTRLEERRRAFREYRQAQDTLRTFESREEVQQRAAQRFARVFGTREEIERQGSDYVSPLTTMFTRAYERYRVAEEVRAEARASDENSDRFQQLVHNLVQPLWSTASQQARGGVVIEERAMTLDDENDARPPPLSDEEMSVTLGCKICLQQKADTAVLPCGHLVMCSFCADVWCPTSQNDQTRPIGRPACPVCRKQVKKRVRIYLA